jgi:hypothetical protein
VVTTNANDRAHLVFLDGTSLTIGPDARVVIDKFVYDASSKTGELALTAGKGVFRLVGGKISKTSAITVTTPSGSIGIRGGISIFTVTSARTTAAFVFGTSLTFTGGGQTQTITRPGFQITGNAGGPPGAPTGIPPGGLTGTIGALEGGAGPGGGSGNADQQAQNSGFSGQNSGQTGNPPTTNPNPGTGTGTGQQQATNAVSNANGERQPENAPTPASTPESTTTPTSPTTPRTSKSLNGYAAGLITNLNGGSSQTRVPVLGGPTDVSIITDASTSQVAGTVKGTIVIRQFNNDVNTLQLGGTTGTALFVDDKTYGMVTSDDPNRPSTVKVGNRTFITTDSTVLATGAPAGVTLVGTAGTCACEYLSWGWWSTVIAYGQGPRNNQSDVVSVAPFVAGTLATSVQLPLTGNASYSGVMAGSVLSGTNAYSAVGSYNSTWNFASRAGTFNGAFDGTNYSGTTAAVSGSGGVNFTGNFAGGNRTGSLAGSFFSAPGDAAKYQAGSFAISGNGPSYKAAGVFAGQR